MIELIATACRNTKMYFLFFFKFRSVWVYGGEFWYRKWSKIYEVLDRLIKNLNIPITLKKSILIYFSGLSLTVTPFGVGQIIKSHFIKKEFGDSISKTAPVIFVEKWNELVAVIVILILC